MWFAFMIATLSLLLAVFFAATNANFWLVVWMIVNSVYSMVVSAVIDYQYHHGFYGRNEAELRAMFQDANLIRG